MKDDQVALLLSDESPVDTSIGVADGYTFHICKPGTRSKMGYISIRIGESPALYYLGHIGYRIDEPFRGRGYAARACTLLIPFLRELGLRSVVITTDPGNTASRKTCEKVGCILESTVPVSEAYREVCMGSAEKCRYILRIPFDRS